MRAPVSAGGQPPLRGADLALYRRLVPLRAGPGTIQGLLRSGEPLRGPSQQSRAAVDRLLQPLQGVGHRLAKLPAALVERELAGDDEPLMIVEGLLARVRRLLSPVGHSLALVGDPVPLVGDAVPLIREALPIIGGRLVTRGTSLALSAVHLQSMAEDGPSINGPSTRIKGAARPFDRAPGARTMIM
jgi:hypothetical protein